MLSRVRLGMVRDDRREQVPPGGCSWGGSPPAAPSPAPAPRPRCSRLWAIVAGGTVSPIERHRRSRNCSRFSARWMVARSAPSLLPRGLLSASSRPAAATFSKLIPQHLHPVALEQARLGGAHRQVEGGLAAKQRGEHAASGRSRARIHASSMAPGSVIDAGRSCGNAASSLGSGGGARGREITAVGELGVTVMMVAGLAQFSSTTR